MNNGVEELEVITIPTKIKYKGVVWVPESKTNNIINNDVKPRNIKKPYIVKWIEKKHPGDMFTLNQFFSLYPKLRKDHVGRKRIDKIIDGMVIDKKIAQFPNDEFKVLKKDG